MNEIYDEAEVDQRVHVPVFGVREISEYEILGGDQGGLEILVLGLRNEPDEQRDEVIRRDGLRLLRSTRGMSVSDG